MKYCVSYWRKQWWTNYVISLSTAGNRTNKLQSWHDTISEDLKNWNGTVLPHQQIEFKSEADYVLFLLKWT